ncbi:hypothetical protein [Chengkuizengella axinellae]|uniref:Uncharacterized protein n=1 Tax=Chengkuizengella axinellae TaxID=3064388 RepID=A0ABT9J394_9BACL|nr:hypothetical protein [Chengkuizengella sp. 2205SS18-9]MDP5275459.1 hypothetical protein [Chengkuizengella sp. 2205SS18-9]
MAFQKVEIRDFQFSPPPVNTLPEELRTNEADPTIVAQVTFKCLMPGDLIWLNGLFHVTNEANSIASVTHIIKKNGSDIYRAETEVDIDPNDNEGQIFKQQYVDQNMTFQSNVTYSLVASSDISNVFRVLPVILTATKIVEGKNRLY